MRPISQPVELIATIEDERIDVPDTVAFTGSELSDLIAASVEQTIAIDTTPKRWIRTLRTSTPPPSAPSSLGRPRQPLSATFSTTGEGHASGSIPPMIYTPATGIPRLQAPRQITSIARTAALGSFGVLLGLLMAVGGFQLSHRAHAASGPSTLPDRSKHEVDDAKVALASPVHEKAARRPMRRFFFTPPAATTAKAPDATPAATPATPSSSIDTTLGDAVLNRPF